MARCRACSPRSPCWRCSGWCSPRFTGWTIRARSAPCGRARAKRTAADDVRTHRRFHRQSVRRHRPECRDGYASSARSKEPADKTPGSGPRRDRSAVSCARRGMVDRQRGARSAFADSGGPRPARRIDRHRRDPAAPCASGDKARGRCRRHRARSRRRLAAAGGWLLATRDRATLMAFENRSIGRLAVGLVAVIPFILTDFQVLAPDIPVRLGALGALLLITAVLIAGGGAETRRQALLALRLGSSALLGAAAACVSPDVDAAQITRFCAIAISGVLTIGLMVDALRAHFEAQVPGVLSSVAASPARTRDQLMAELVRHPIFESARRYRESDLAAYDPPLLREFLSTRRVLRHPEAPWGLTSSDPAVERVASLMAANRATHLIILSHDPVDVIVLAVPVISADPATETALALVRRLLALTPEAA